MGHNVHSERLTYACTAAPGPQHSQGPVCSSGATQGAPNRPLFGQVLGRHKDGVAKASGSDALLVLGTAGNFVVDGRRPLQSNQEQRQRFGRVALDAGRFPWPGMHAHMMNDPHGTRQRPNVRVTTGGFVETMQRVPPGRELLWSYGEGYHA